MKNNQLDRRKFLRNSLLATGGMFIAPVIVSCSNDDQVVEPNQEVGEYTMKGFSYGVASFDPTPQSVIIWTRYDLAGEVVTWEIAKDIEFKEIVRQGVATAFGETDNTISIEVNDLEAKGKYFYRFYQKGRKEISVIGETITLAAQGDSSSEVRLAVLSCSNYPAGLFNVYEAVAKSDVDVVIHLGDYIYEYGQGEYGTNASTTVLNRQPKPSHELVSLDDYRTRYKQYRSDEDLKLAHQKKPFICVWDDHEIANDTYKDGAENHQSDKEGAFEIRKASAIQAYSEYIPMKTGKGKPIYRAFEFGSVLSMYMLDTRVLARDKQLEYADYFTAEGMDVPRFTADLSNPNRKLLGMEQMNWLASQVNSSTAKWQVLGQQVLMSKMTLPLSLLLYVQRVMLEFSATGTVRPETTQGLFVEAQRLIMIKERLKQNDPTLTQEEIMSVKAVAPYNLDAWDGYPVEREMLYKLFNNKQIITLAGDTHNAWYNTLTDQDANVIGHEFATSSVSSPGMEEYLGIQDVSQLKMVEQVFESLVDDLQYCDLSNRGYLYMNFTTSSIHSEWRYVSTISSKDYSISVKKQVTI
ncbi:alkaline phosphatase D family protein [Myroides pelagicus]|uniref:Alkaline phosphatase n=1 Tax=Myroides pelagicus TaxID=270914 RepID=A0A7K1GJ35_9FLAO|nr:alkaline phosphatase D family protein [Myroides pelagicus]MEC4113709.1 alkaline phosphatase D family protein [Myroides pelagicus]MTH28905.1 alkaline phosphatase [Myroides pelagicus]